MDCVGGRCAHVYMAVPCATGTDGPFLASSLAACIGLIGLPTTGQADDPSQSDVSYISIVFSRLRQRFMNYFHTTRRSASSSYTGYQSGTEFSKNCVSSELHPQDGAENQLA